MRAECSPTTSPSGVHTFAHPSTWCREVVSKAPKDGQLSVFQSLASRYPDLPLLHAVGRLDYMSEGLLLFTNAGEVSRCLEHPFNAFERQYHVELTRDYRALPSLLTALSKPMVVDGTEYRSVSATSMGNKWVHVRLTEGLFTPLLVVFHRVQARTGKSACCLPSWV